MTKLTFTRSLMSFNERVLYFGGLQKGTAYSLEELKEKLFFNQIFIENSQELFQKHDCSDIINRYIDGMNRYIHNLSSIVKEIMKAEPTIHIERRDSFERRLVTETKIDNQVISNLFRNIEQVRYRFLNNVTYYLSRLENGMISISFIDPRRQIYDRPLSFDFPQYTSYWKADDCVISYIDKMYQVENTVAIRVTTKLDETNEIIKVEYNGKDDNMRQYLEIFPPTALILSNPYIYIEDIGKIIDRNVDDQPIEMPKNDWDELSFQQIFDGDLLIEYPNESFDEYLQFLSLASMSKSVSAIYLSLYRIGKDPIIYYILREAIKNGIEVYVNVELWASGETINLLWERELKAIGVHVTSYAAGKLKIHSKLTLIRFRDGKMISSIGTGNYHSQTTTQYTDLSLMTADLNIGRQVLELFELFNGTRKKLNLDKNLLVTRYNARQTLMKLIREEAMKGPDGYISMKCNAIDDEAINGALEIAARAGCQIDLVVRGVCTWVHQQLGHNVMIKSIVWDKLEHSRIYCFGKMNPTIYLGSLDLVTNKLDKRIETLVQINDVHILEEVCNYLNRYIINQKNSWRLMANGEYLKEVE